MAVEDVRIRYSPKKLKKTAVQLWILAAVFIIVFLIARVNADGYWGAALYGSSFGAALGSVFIALIFSLRLGDRFNKSACMAVICKDGIRITDEPYSYGLIRWENITGFKMKKARLNVGAKFFILPMLSDPDAFMNALPKKKRKIAKRSRRLGSPAAFDITHAELSPNEVLELFNSQFEIKKH